MRYITTFIRALCALGLAATAAGTRAQEPFPHKQPVELVVIFPAGSSADVSARLLAEGMAQHLGVAVPVNNKPGAGGAIGYKFVAASRPDGRTLVWNSNSVSTTYHSGAMDIDYKAFEPVARVTIENPAVVVQASAPWKTLADLIQHARANPGMLKIGNSGSGSHTHFAAVSLFEAAGVKVLDVPFGAAQVMPALLGGHIDAVVQLPAAVAPNAASGALRVLGVLGTARDPLFPDAPTAQEAGIKMAPMDLWRGVAAPKGTPAAAIARLASAVEAAVNRPEFASAGRKFGFVPAYLPAAEFASLIAREDQFLSRQMQALGLAKPR
jgi:tripartite-type tricarboxylate transporter receptor subunit TctC